jgi:serine/threonine-protein kinase
MSGDTVGRYRLLKMLARGGMGEVFLARQEGLKGFSKTVVVKRILDHLSEDKSFSEMFVNEARLAALITHPNVVQVFDLGEEDGVLYLAMEYVHGHTLRQLEQELVKRGRLMPPPLAARICQQALLGLSHAHGVRGDDGAPLNLVHRDVSPDNILIGYDGSVKVTDFGIAKAVTSQGLTQAGLVKGKIAYMPPEQVKAEGLDARTDIYAMGTVLYELLAGRRPFSGQSDTGLMLAIIQEAPPPLHELVPDIDPALERIVFDALEKNPAYRFQSAAEMASALDGYAQTVRGPMVQSAIHQLLVELFGEEAPPSGVVERAPQLATPVGDETVRMTATSAGLMLAEAPPVRDTVPAHQLVTQTADMPSPQVRRERSSVAWPIAMMVVALATGGGVFAWLKLHPPEPAAVISMAPSPPVARPAPKAEAPVPAPAPLEPAPSREPQAAPAPAPAAAAPTAAPVAPAAEAAKTGRVQVDVAPWGELFLGNKSLGITPMPPVTLPAGAQVLVVKNPDLKVERKVKVKVVGGGTTRVFVNLLE